MQIQNFGIRIYIYIYIHRPLSGRTRLLSQVLELHVVVFTSMGRGNPLLRRLSSFVQHLQAPSQLSLDQLGVENRQLFQFRALHTIRAYF